MTTLRPIDPIDVRSLAPATPATGAPIFETVDPRTLFVDPAYQRALSERSIRQIRRIIEAFDWTKFKPPVCAFSEDEAGVSVLKVIDGQHTAIAAASNPHVGQIPIMIVEAPDVRSQASAFIGQNSDRLGMTATQMHVAAVAAGEDQAIAVADICERAGVRIRRNPPSGGSGYEPGDTVAVAALSVLLKRNGAGHGTSVLKILAGAGLAPIKADHVKAVDFLLTDPQFAAVDLDALPGHIEAQAGVAEKEAKTFAATHGVPLWRALASVWFQKAKKVRQAQAGAAKNREADAARSVGPRERGYPGSEAAPAPGVPDDLVADTRRAFRAWSPGHHVRRCVKCDTRFRGSRMAMECASCAYEDQLGDAQPNTRSMV